MRIIFAMALVCLTGCTAQGGTAEVTAEQCELQAKVAYAAGTARDQGTSEATLKNGLHSPIDSDVLTIIKATYRNPTLRNLPPESLAVGALRSCMKRSRGES